VVLLDWVLPDMDGADALRLLRQCDAEVRVIVMSAYDWDSLHVNAQQAGAASFLSKPILPTALRNLLVRRAGGELAGDSTRKRGERAVRLDGLRVLMAEDNVVNQQLATELLSRRGALVDVVNNGCEALECLRLTGALGYDVVLMDLHMPVMDGYEATRQIRLDPSLAQVPILAMTAHALQEERERCLASGMQGHISKPLDPQRLYATLERYRPDSAEGLSSPQIHPSERGDLPVQLPMVDGLNTSEAVARLSGDTALYSRVLLGYLQHMEGTIGPLQRAIETMDSTKVEYEAHTLLGLSSTVGANHLAQLAKTLESVARAKDLAGVKAVGPSVVQAMVAMAASLRQQLPRQVSSDEDEPGEPETVPGELCELPEPVKAMARQARQTLMTLLADDDSQAMAVWLRERRAFKKTLPPLVFNRLNSAMERCDFDSALSLLTEGCDDGDA
jgi:two-component system sensor histidine kinase/response regulator